MAAPARSGSKLYALFKQGWREIPEVMGSSIYPIVGMFVCAYSLYKYEKSEVKKPYKMEYSVIRDDDPEAEVYRKFAQRPVKDL